MKRFGFRLEKVLNYREEIEQQRQLVLARAVEAVEAQKRELERLQEAAAEAMAEMRKSEGTKVDVAMLRVGLAHLGAVRRKATKTSARLEVASKESAEARERLIDARKDRRALELLRAQRAAEYDHETDVQDQKELDEIGSRPWQVERAEE